MTFLEAFNPISVSTFSNPYDNPGLVARYDGSPTIESQLPLQIHSARRIKSINFTCGNCSQPIPPANARGQVEYYLDSRSEDQIAGPRLSAIIECPNCGTFREEKSSSIVRYIGDPTHWELNPSAKYLYESNILPGELTQIEVLIPQEVQCVGHVKHDPDHPFRWEWTIAAAKRIANAEGLVDTWKLDGIANVDPEEPLSELLEDDKEFVYPDPDKVLSSFAPNERILMAWGSGTALDDDGKPVDGTKNQAIFMPIVKVYEEALQYELDTGKCAQCLGTGNKQFTHHPLTGPQHTNCPRCLGEGTPFKEVTNIE